MWQTILNIAAPLGILVAGFLAVWYKNRATADAGAVTTLAQAAKEAETKRVAQEAETAARDAADRVKLSSELTKINEVKDDHTKLQLSLDELARLRGTH